MEHSDCTFCGLCTQVCPVGAPAEKRAERWPHLEEPEIIKTTCQMLRGLRTRSQPRLRRRSRIVRVTHRPDNPTAPTAGRGCFMGRYGFRDVRDSGNFDPRSERRPVSLDGRGRLRQPAAKNGAVFVAERLSPCRRQELSATMRRPHTGSGHFSGGRKWNSPSLQRRERERISSGLPTPPSNEGDAFLLGGRTPT